MESVTRYFKQLMPQQEYRFHRVAVYDSARDSYFKRDYLDARPTRNFCRGNRESYVKIWWVNKRFGYYADVHGAGYCLYLKP